MEDSLMIYIDRLASGNEEVINAQVSAKLMDIHEADLEFSAPLILQGKAYLAERHLVLHFMLDACARMRCAICNEFTPLPIQIPSFIHTVPLSEIKSSVYNCSDSLREAILLEVPNYVECKGNCPKRAELDPFLSKKKGDLQDKIRLPFADLTYEEGGNSNGCT